MENVLTAASELRVPGEAIGPEIPDKLLVDRFRNGEKAAFHALVNRYKDSMVGYMFRIVNDAAWAEDLAQDVFLKLFLNAGKFRAESRFSTWIFRIAHNRAMDYLKRRKNEPRLVLDSADDAPGEEKSYEMRDFRETPAMESQMKEVEDGVMRVIQEMDEKYRSVFVLCAMQRMSYEDASEATGLPVKTVSSRLCRARRFFRAKAGRWIDAQA